MRGLIVAFCWGLAACAATQASTGAVRVIDGIELSRVSAEAYDLAVEAFDHGGYGDFVAAGQRARQATGADAEAVFPRIALASFPTSPQVFAAALEAAKARAGGASAGERLWIRALYLSFIDNDTAGGLNAARALTERMPDSPRAWMLLAGLQAATNDHPASRETAERALERDPEFVPAYNFLGFSYLLSPPTDFAAAEIYATKVAELRPKRASPWVTLGDVYRAKLELGAAREAYSRALALDAGHALAAVKRAHVNSFLGELDAARADYDLGIGASEGALPATLANYRAFVHLHAGDATGAMAELEEVLTRIDAMELTAGDAAGARIFTLQNLATIAFHTGDRGVATRAVERLTAALAQQAEGVADPAFARAQKAAALYWQGKLAAYTDDFSGALARAEAYVEVREPDENPRKLENYHELLGIVSLRQKQYDAAVEHYRQSNLQFGDILTKYHLAEALAGAGDAEAARSLFREVADWSFNSVGYALLRKHAGARANGT